MIATPTRVQHPRHPVNTLKTRVVALVGNPNTGKTTLFNALTGFRQRVANYPGVTVEKKSGPLRLSASRHRLKTGGTLHRLETGATPHTGATAVIVDAPIEVIDLPGTYGLAARSRDEMVVADVLMGRQNGTRRPDLIVSVLDASNLQRNLLLTTQVMELGLPVIVALNMVDVAEQNGVHIDAARLERQLGVPVVATHAHRGRGLERLSQSIRAHVDSPPPTVFPRMPEEIQGEVESLRRFLMGSNGDDEEGSGFEKGFSNPRSPSEDGIPHSAELLQVLLEPGGYAERRLAEEFPRSVTIDLAARRERIVGAGFRLTDVEAEVRYAWIRRALDQVEHRVEKRAVNWSDRVDRVLTHRAAGFVVFLGLMALVFQAIYSWASPVMDSIEGVFGLLAGMVGGWMPAGALRSLVVDGMISGVGGVLVFLPQILILFLFIGILEDCGYMARGALLLHRVMSVFGLNGKAFIPLLSSFACAVPGIMATRTIENRGDRLVTILVAPLMSCSARLPVYALLIGAFVPARAILGGWFGLQGLVLLAMYLVGVVVAIPVALVLRRGVFRERRQPFVIELPSYKWPQWKTVFYRVYERGREFVVRAGTIIFAVSILIWAMAYYPHPPVIAAEFEQQRVAIESSSSDDAARQAALDHLDREEAGAYLRQSVLGRMGRAIEPAVVPLGWDWRIGMAAVASFPAREVIIATLGTIFNLGGDVDEGSSDLKSALSEATWPDGRPLFNLPVALSVMVFFALCCQCAATLSAIKRETNSWGWPAFTFVYMTALAYGGAWVTYQVGS